ncbi:hypothetical protein F4815DRAFT_61539 [Daldinia loculata]|uniref:uncharacterized protein n=1 Tax=Daldinia loculata TaxID=103429 RepID=UPI0020C4060B|nr:uncharacterized protein F4817DRAFT_131380 [Daldinia loculata]KAI1651441.1 hypothetical protein F4817DRAFT_131380 [Daldinia loculata]KAI2781867.1 hypothetical protein F4815DRAFT_61539 [Daldinia loculata]
MTIRLVGSAATRLLARHWILFRPFFSFSPRRCYGGSLLFFLSFTVGNLMISLRALRFCFFSSLFCHVCDDLTHTGTTPACFYEGWKGRGEEIKDGDEKSERGVGDGLGGRYYFSRRCWWCGRAVGLICRLDRSWCRQDRTNRADEERSLARADWSSE